ncbi:ABC transporter substrate-binding protein [Cohnella lupini]|uniref:Carbohydrate ABC transporter substrate-binding protein (CUT1 family) n=1 Tax=Cohnella lupini TaxID=1294267 RepID=A0A3D9ISL7_9BACL|nr:extracellular solute-binding protein [Cohnella lupini]RED64781.1 carbohydrate ABC transporter substrate-binding protein (CUT1 family) [Cohnella lupini]
MKKRNGLALLALSFSILTTACSNGSENTAAIGGSNPANAAANKPADTSNAAPAAPAKDPVTLNFSTNASGGTLEAFKAITDQFNQAHQGITVEVADLGKDFNTLMTAKMASNDMPDLFSTAGWSVRRFGEYLLPLNDRSWAGQVEGQIKPVVTDMAGNLVALPMDIDISGIVYNAKILKDLNLTVPQTWDQFLADCEAIKKAGLTPIAIAGKDGDAAGFMSRIALSLLVQSNPSYKDAFDSKTFDWKQFGPVTDFVLNLKAKGYLNKDNLTADKPSVYAQFAKDQVAFAFQSNQTIAEIKKLNPDSSVSMMMLPVSGDGAQPFLISGERDSVGVWKDSKHQEEALTFLDFLAQPENVQKIAESYALPAGLTGVKSDLGALQSVYDQYAQAAVSNHFDRQYLPNGMYTTLGTVGTAILSGTMDPAHAESALSDDYVRLNNAN